MNVKQQIKLQGWYLKHDRPRIKRQIKQFLHILKVEETEYYNEFDKYYKDLDVEGKVVVDLGADIGASPMYFLNKGAKFVIGFSMEKAYFHNKNYVHVTIRKQPFYPNVVALIVKSIKEELSIKSSVLKSDCEGCEWERNSKFIEAFDDWIIAVHRPVKNQELLDYIIKNGNLVATPDPKCEFAIYKKNLNTFSDLITKDKNVS